MLIKSADDRSDDIAEIKALLDEPKLSSYKRQLILDELWNLEKGIEGEKKTAYYLDFHFKSYKRTILLHDLRLELSDGKVAQIDHLIINRFLEIYVLETKNWSQLTVDENGDCTTGAKETRGTEDPLEQCKRHAQVLKRAFEVDPELKKLAPRFDITSRVLVAPKCLLKAPHHRQWYLKADAFHTTWCKEVEDLTPSVKNILSVTRLSQAETLQKIGERLLELHDPIRPNLRTKFGFPAQAPETPSEKIIRSIPGLAEYVPKKGPDWFILKRSITTTEKNTLNASGFFGRKENRDWVWELKR